MKVRGPEFSAWIMCLKRRSQSGISVTSDPVTKLDSNRLAVNAGLQPIEGGWDMGASHDRMGSRSSSEDMPTEFMDVRWRTIHERKTGKTPLGSCTRGNDSCVGNLFRIGVCVCLEAGIGLGLSFQRLA